MANSVLVVTPPNGYTVFPGGVSQVPIYPNQSQVHVIHGNPPSVSQQPIERTLKEGKALGVSETSLCRKGVTCLELEEGGVLEIQTLQI